MKRSGLIGLFVGASLVLMVLGSTAVAAQGIYGARDGSTLGGPPPGTAPTAPGDPIIDEGFDDITNLPGWVMQNNSSPLGSTDWFQGNADVFPAQSGAASAYIAANFNNSGSPGIISNWLLTPELDWSIVADVAFWTRTVTGNTFPDRMEVRASTAGASSDVGTGANDVGDFTILLLEINPNLVQGGYPDDWAQYSALPTPSSGSGRLAFRYFVTDSGPAGSNSNYIGIDTVQIVEGLPAPTMGPAAILALMVLLAMGASFALRRRAV